MIAPILNYPSTSGTNAASERQQHLTVPATTCELIPAPLERGSWLSGEASSGGMPGAYELSNYHLSSVYNVPTCDSPSTSDALAEHEHRGLPSIYPSPTPVWNTLQVSTYQPLISHAHTEPESLAVDWYATYLPAVSSTARGRNVVVAPSSSTNATVPGSYGSDLPNPTCPSTSAAVRAHEEQHPPQRRSATPYGLSSIFRGPLERGEQPFKGASSAHHERELSDKYLSTVLNVATAVSSPDFMSPEALLVEYAHRDPDFLVSAHLSPSPFGHERRVSRPLLKASPAAHPVAVTHVEPLLPRRIIRTPSWPFSSPYPILPLPRPSKTRPRSSSSISVPYISQRRKIRVPTSIPTAVNEWACPHCPYVQLNNRKPDLRRHIATHNKPTRRQGARWTCCGVPIGVADQHEVPDRVRHERSMVIHEGLAMVGGCAKTFTRKDALLRHLRVRKGICFGDAGAEWHAGNRSCLEY